MVTKTPLVLPRRRPRETRAHTVAGVTDPKQKRRIIFSSLVGTTIEFYDFYIYATAAVAVFPFLFFPAAEDPTIGLLSSFATFGLAFVARPLGSLLFGHFGDVIGRKATLVASLLTMGIATFLIGLLPTYAQAGIIAPALLAVMRFCQGLGLGGEWSGAALLATETAEEGKRGWAAMWPQLGAPLGFLFANGLFLIIVTVLGHTNGDTHGAFMECGWRLPFLLSAVMVILGLWMRLKLEETPVFQHAVTRGQKVQSPAKEAFRTSWRPMILGTAIMISCYTLFYLVTTWVLSYGIGRRDLGLGLGIPYTEFLALQLISIFAFIVAVPLSGKLGDVIGRRRLLTWVSAGMILFGLTFTWYLDPDTATKNSVLLFLTIGMFLMGLVFGPMSAVLPELFPTNVRYTGSGISYNVSSILGAAVAPFIATALVASFGVSAVGIYLTLASILSLVGILIMRETRHIDLAKL